MELKPEKKGFYPNMYTSTDTIQSNFDVSTATVVSSEPPEKRAGGLSAKSTLINFVKGMIGPGCLSLPIAFHQAGLWTALILIFAFGFLNNYCMLQLVECSQKLSKKRGKVLDYGGVSYHACSHSFPFIRPYNNVFRNITNGVIILLQLGICSVFYVFVASHVKELFDDNSDIRLSPTIWSLLVLFPMIIVNLLRTLKMIAILSVVGNICMISCLIFIMQYLVRKPLMITELPGITNFDGILMACGSILYSFEGQAMVLPMENKLKRPASMIGPFGVLSVGMTIVTFVYAACGFFGYAVYGNNVQGSITLNLPNETAFTGVKALLIFVIYSGFVIQQYVIVDMVWPRLKKVIHLDHLSYWPDFLCEAIFRTLLVLIECKFVAIEFQAVWVNDIFLYDI
uniref:Aa_trans domain-containing protein n=1 Tax=Bursaphelenchus xylophilus TaxID=6326 RepID=A0A1I7SGQ3_BURXY